MKIEKFNDALALFYMVFMVVWVLLTILAVHFLDISVVEALGLGTATGVLLAILKDVFQFYFRMNKPTDTTNESGKKVGESK